MSKGLLIAFEGVDKAGKGTQSRILAEKLNATRIAFPRYDTLVGKVIKRHLMGDISTVDIRAWDDGRVSPMLHQAPDDPLVFQCLMLADKVHAATEITGLLNLGRHVVLDRWIDSALAYGGADGLNTEWLETVHAALPKADFTVFLDIDPALTDERGRAPGDDRQRADRYESDLPRLAKVYENYRAMFNGPTRHHRARVTVNGGFPVEIVSNLVWGLCGFAG